MKILDMIAWLLLVIGGLNWGLAIGQFNVVTAIFGADSALTTLTYALIGVSAIYAIFRCGKCCKCSKCGKDSSCKM